MISTFKSRVVLFAPWYTTIQNIIHHERSYLTTPDPYLYTLEQTESRTLYSRSCNLEMIRCLLTLGHHTRTFHERIFTPVILGKRNHISHRLAPAEHGNKSVIPQREACMRRGARTQDLKEMGEVLQTLFTHLIAMSVYRSREGILSENEP